MNPDPSTIKAAQEKLDAHVREIVQWHFSPETGSRSGSIGRKRPAGIPPTEVKCFADLLRFPHFQDEWLRDLPNEVWVPKQYQGPALQHL